jgi:ABC-type uncharacterized transport system permease subunit
MLPFDRIHVFCFAASYSVAFLFELLNQFLRRPVLRLLSLCFGCAGLFAHTVYVLVQPLLLASPFGSLVLLGWVLAVFYVYGSFHHRRIAWGVFVLPLVLGLTLLADLSPRGGGPRDPALLLHSYSWDGERFWGQVHGGLVLLAAVGVSVGFVASVMYLVQAHRLRTKVPPGQGVKLPSLERLETMNRRALILAFPLLTIGLLVGLVLAVHNDETFVSWGNPKLWSILGLWVVFGILLYLRYGARAPGRQTAFWTIVAFGLLVLSLASPVHPFLPGGTP